MKTSQEIKENVQKIARKSSLEGLVAGTSGNVSYFDRETELLYITPSNMDYKTMGIDDIMVMCLDGEIVDGEHQPSSEWNLHGEIYRAKADVNAVIHTHSPYATGFAIIGEGIPLILVEMLPFLGGDVPIARFGLPGTKEVGVHAADVMKNRNAALLENHGVVAAGKSLDQVYLRAVYVEDAAKAYHLARLMGNPRLIPREAELTLRERYHLPE